MRLAILASGLLLAARVVSGLASDLRSTTEMVLYSSVVMAAMVVGIIAGIIAFKDATDKATEDYRHGR